MIPAYTVAIIMRKLMVIVVIPFAECDEGGNDMIVTGMFCGIGLHTESVGKTVDTESGLMDKEHSTKTSIHKGAPKIAPPKRGDGKRKHKAEKKSDREVIAMLKHDTTMGIEIANIHSS